MVEVKVGNEFKVAGAYTGKTNKGAYWKQNVCAEKGYDKIAVWATNPDEAARITGMAKVESIQSVKLGAHQYNGKWYPDYTVNAKLVQGSAEEPIEFGDQLEITDDELPF